MNSENLNFNDYFFSKLLKRVNIFKMKELFEEPSTYEDDEDNTFIYTEK